MQKQNCFPKSLCSLHKTRESKKWDITGTKNEKTLYINWTMINNLVTNIHIKKLSLSNCDVSCKLQSNKVFLKAYC